MARVIIFAAIFLLKATTQVKSAMILRYACNKNFTYFIGRYTYLVIIE